MTRYKVTTHWDEVYVFEIGGASRPLRVDDNPTPFQGADYCCGSIHDAVELFFSWDGSGFEDCGDPEKVAEVAELCDVEEIEDDE